MQNASLPVFGRGFETYHHRQMDIGRTPTFLKAVSPLKFASDVKTEKESQGYEALALFLSS